MQKTDKYYFDTCTIIDIIDSLSPFHNNVIKAVAQAQDLWALSEYMENELKSILRHAEKFVKRKDSLLKEYFKLKQSYKSSFIPNDSRTLRLHIFSKNHRIRPLKFQDVVHIGICGLKNIPNIISEDWHIYGRSMKYNQPFIDIVKQALTSIQNFSNPKHAFTTRQGYLKKEV